MLRFVLTSLIFVVGSVQSSNPADDVEWGLIPIYSVVRSIVEAFQPRRDFWNHFFNIGDISDQIKKIGDAHSFDSVNESTTIILTKINETLTKYTKLDAVDQAQSVTSYYLGFTILGVIIVFLILLTCIVPCFACCCCGSLPETLKQAKYQRRWKSFLLSVVTAVLLAAIIVAACSSTVVYMRSKDSTDDTTSAIDKTFDKIADTIVDGASLAHNFFNQTMDVSVDLLTSVQTSLARIPVLAMASLDKELQLNKTLDEVLDVVETIETKLDNIRAVLTQFVGNATSLADDSNLVKSELDAFINDLKTKCSVATSQKAACDDIVKKLTQTLTSLVSVESLKTTYKLDEVLSSMDTFTGVSTEATDAVAKARVAMTNTISEAMISSSKDASNTAKDKYDSFRKNLTDDVAEKIRGILDTAPEVRAMQAQTGMNEILSYAWYGTLGVCGLAFVFVVFLFGGVFCSCSHGARSCGRCSLCFSIAFWLACCCIIVLVISLALFLPGSMMQTEMCRTVQTNDEEMFLPINLVTENVLGFTVNSVISKCSQNSTIFMALFDPILATMNLRNISKLLSYANLTADQIDLTAPNVDFNDMKMDDIIQQAEKIRDMDFYQSTNWSEVTEALRKVDTSTLQQPLAELDKLKLSNELAELTKIQNGSFKTLLGTQANMQQNLNELLAKPYITESGAQIVRVLNDTKNRLNDTQFVIDKVKVAVFDSITDRLQTTWTQSLAKLAGEDGARCGNIYNSATEVVGVPCDQLLAPYNTFWLSLVIFAFLAIIAMPIAYSLRASYYDPLDRIWRCGCPCYYDSRGYYYKGYPE